MTLKPASRKRETRQVPSMTLTILAANIESATIGVDDVFTSKVALNFPGDHSSFASLVVQNMSLSQAAIVLVVFTGATAFFVRSHAVNKNGNDVLALAYMLACDVEKLRFSTRRGIGASKIVPIEPSRVDRVIAPLNIQY